MAGPIDCGLMTGSGAGRSSAAAAAPLPAVTGWALSSTSNGCDFGRALRMVAAALGMAGGAPAPARAAPCPAPARRQKRTTLSPDGSARWHRARPITPDDPAGRYLAARACAPPPPDGDLRWHPRVLERTEGLRTVCTNRPLPVRIRTVYERGVYRPRPSVRNPRQKRDQLKEVAFRERPPPWP